MTNNRLYIVNKSNGEYCCIAKLFNYCWKLGNVELLEELLGDSNEFDDFAIGAEGNKHFYDKWIKDGTNINAENIWDYYK